MTIKMLIVDDEPIICQGLKDTIPWRDMNVEVIGTSYNGKQALAIMNEKNIDLVLTDVYMHEMNGLELSKHISNDFPNTRIIMLSGYDEFEYARQAIRLDIEDYLLKPVDIDELTLLVKKVKRNIINQKKEEKNQTENYIVQQLHHHLFGSPIYSQDTRRDRSVISSYYIIVSEICNYYLLKKSLTNTELSNLREKWK